MNPFVVERPQDLALAIGMGAELPSGGRGTDFIAGGTDLVQLLQENVRTPSRLVALAGLLDRRIEVDAEGLYLGAGATMAEVASHPVVRAEFPLISQALLNSASPQVRNMATVGGNLLQRTRCPYFRDIGNKECNKRSPGSGCAAINGESRWQAILGTSPLCNAAHASDLAVALVALDASLQLRGAAGERGQALADFYRLPEDAPQLENHLQQGEVITAIRVPASALSLRSHYLKVRDRASFEFALVSVAVAMEFDAGHVRRAKVAAGGIGTTPWRLPKVEAALIGARLESSAFRWAAAFAAEGASGHGSHAFKVELLQRAIVRALETAGEMT